MTTDPKRSHVVPAPLTNEAAFDARCFHWRRQVGPHTWCVNGTVEVREDGSCLVRPEASSVTVGEIEAGEARRMAVVILGLRVGSDGFAWLAQLTQERDAAVSALEAETKAHRATRRRLDRAIDTVTALDGTLVATENMRSDVRRLESELAEAKALPCHPVESETTRGQLQAGLDFVASALGRPALLVGEHAGAVAKVVSERDAALARVSVLEGDNRVMRERLTRIAYHANHPVPGAPEVCVCGRLRSEHTPEKGCVRLSQEGSALPAAPSPQSEKEQA